MWHRLSIKLTTIPVVLAETNCRIFWIGSQQFSQGIWYGARQLIFVKVAASKKRIYTETCKVTRCKEAQSYNARIHKPGQHIKKHHHQCMQATQAGQECCSKSAVQDIVVIFVSLENSRPTGPLSLFSERLLQRWDSTASTRNTNGWLRPAQG